MYLFTDGFIILNSKCQVAASVWKYQILEAALRKHIMALGKSESEKYKCIEDELLVKRMRKVGLGSPVEVLP